MENSVVETKNGGGPLVEVTLQSLSGITYQTESIWGASCSIPKVTAAVSFSGSASDMQVGSSFVCPKSGHLMVESELATPAAPSPTLELNQLTPTSTSNNDTMKRKQLWCQWHDGGLSHCTIRLPTKDPNVPPLPLSRLNRDSRVVRNIPSLDDSDVSTELSSPSSCASPPKDINNVENNHNNKMDRSNTASPEIQTGTSVIWSSTGASHLPEILELNVSLKVDPEYLARVSSLDESSSHDSKTSECHTEVGIAHLVLLSSEGGTTLMDLPVKKRRTAKKSNNNIQDLNVRDSAFLRIKVTVYPDGQRPPMGSSDSIMPRYSEDIMKVQLQHDELFKPILEQLHNAEQRVRKRLENDDHEPANIHVPVHQCDFNLWELWKRAAEFWNNCHDDEDGIQAIGAGADGQNGIDRALSMTSTIDTSPSLRYW